MDAKISEHIAALLLEIAREYEKGYVLFRDELFDTLNGRFGLHLPQTAIDSALTELEELGSLEVIKSPLTGDMIQIQTGITDFYFRDRTVSDFSTEDKFSEISKKFPVIQTYYRGGEQWINRVVAFLRNHDLENYSDFAGSSWGAVPEGVAVPASDRVVSLSHNQSGEIDDVSTQLILEIEKENAIDGDASLRARILGQIKAGRELIRAGVFSIHLLQQTLLTTLGGLIEKYSGTLIGETAKVLLGLLIQHVFI